MPAATSPDADIELRNRCTRWLNGHRPLRSMREALLALADVPEAALPLDVYGQGEAVQALERQVAALLGKPAARYFHKGVAAQLAALRVHCGDGDGPVALHPQSHIAIDEADAFEQLMGLRGLRVGVAHRACSCGDLMAEPGRPAVVTVELPLRRAGYLLPDWEDLVLISGWCRQARVPLHIDGARLWEAAAHYGRPLHEIAALADSVYVSFYKGLGGLAGCVLAGSAEFIAATAPWQTRLAGNVYTQAPFVLGALEGLRTQLPRMPSYRARAQRLAALLAAEPGWRVWPEPPQVNAFQLHLPVAPGMLRERLLAVAARDGFWLGARAGASHLLAGGAMVEVVIGDTADGWDDADALQALRAAVS